MSSTLVSTASEKLAAVLPAAAKEHSRTIVLVAGGTVTLLALRALGRAFPGYRTNPFAFGRTGALAKDDIDKSNTDYMNFFAQKEGKGIDGKIKSNTPEFVDKFYRRASRLSSTPRARAIGSAAASSCWGLAPPREAPLPRSLITDFYEYGWGQSFHFAPRLRSESFDVRPARGLAHHSFLRPRAAPRAARAAGREPLPPSLRARRRPSSATRRTSPRRSACRRGARPLTWAAASAARCAPSPPSPART